MKVLKQSNPNQLLDVLTPAGREILLGQSIERRFTAGEILWSAGDQSEGIALVLEGKVRIVRGSGGRQAPSRAWATGNTGCPIL